MKRTLDTYKEPPYYDASCSDPSCGGGTSHWSGGQEAQAAARKHTRETGHETICTTSVEYTYRRLEDE